MDPQLEQRGSQREGLRSGAKGRHCDGVAHLISTSPGAQACCKLEDTVITAELMTLPLGSRVLTAEMDSDTRNTTANLTCSGDSEGSSLDRRFQK